MNAFPLRSVEGKDAQCKNFYLTSELKKESEIKSIKIRKEEVKLPLFVDDMIIYIESLNESTKQLLAKSQDIR